MTFQEAFDLVLETMRGRDYQKAMTADRCVMCTEDGTRCAVGLIAEAEPGAAFGVAWDAAVEKLSQGSHPRKVTFLDNLQICHDGAKSAEHFEAMMRDVAEGQHLVYKALDS